MPIDTFKPRGPSKLSGPSAGGAPSKQYPIIGVVKDNIDPTRAGRIRVALQDGKGPVAPDNASGWVTVQHLTTFFGVVRPQAGKDSKDLGSYVTNSSSYGQWQAPPDIGTKVICIFVNGDTNAGFYIGSVPEPETLQMVPAIGASETVTLNDGEAKSFGGATRLPVTNLNTNNKAKADSNEFLDTPRPVHSYTASIMNQQGILRDPVRGPISSSASREAASRVGWGVSTPGRPIYEGGYTDETLPENLSQGKAEQLKVVARRGGHSIVMDDGDIIGRDQLIRIRTALGHQIMMSDDGQTLMILHSNGQSYIELGKEGTVDIFSTNSINMRTQGDFNIHADRDINMHAAENFNLQAKNIHTNSEEITKARAGKDFNITSLNNFTVKSSAALALNAGGQASMVAGAEAFVNGSKVNLNSGSASLTAVEVPIIPINAQADTLFDPTVGWAAAPAKLLSVASRAPAHYPWVNAGMGVDIKASPNASDNLPEPSSSAVQQVNKQAAATNPTPPQVATVASVPAVPSSSASLGQGTTNAVLAASATAAAGSDAAKAVGAGAGIVNKSGSSLISGINSALSAASSAAGGVITAANQVAGSINQAAVAVGSFAQSPQQLAQSGILKPGAESLVSGLASAGKTLTNAMPASLFAGVAGAESITKLASSSVAQATSLVNVMQTAQQQLTQAGVINGTESTTQTAGLIAAASTVGTASVVDVVKQVSTVTNALQTATSITSGASSIANIASVAGAALPGQLQSATNLLNNVSQTASSLTSIANGSKNVLGAIGSGISAAKLSDSLGGLGGIANSLGALSGAGTSLTGLLDSVKGVSGSAFSAIKDSFGTLEPNKPQFLSDFAKQTAAITAVAENVTAGQLPSTKSLSSLVTGIGSVAADAARLSNNINNAVGSITGATRGLTGAANSLTGTANSLTSTVNQIAGAANNLTSTVNQITNTATSISNTINSVTGSATGIATTVNSLTGTVNSVTNTLNSVAGAASSLSRLPNTINPGTINNTLVNATNQLATAAGSITNTVNSISNAVNNLGGASQQVTSLINSTTGASVNNLATSISGAFDNINSMAGAATSLKDGLSGLANAAKKTQAGGLAAKASQLSSGVSNLPGGIKAFSSVLDKADGAINKIPGTDQLTGIMNDLQTGVNNGVGQLSSALSSANATLGQVNSAVNTATSTINAVGSIAGAAGLGSLASIASKAGGLTSSIASKLPIGQATQLLSSVSALGAGGASPIKLPNLGINTTDRTSITSQIKGILGDARIPIPITSIENRARTLKEERRKIQAQIDTAKEEEIAAGDAFITAFNTLPEGDPSLAALEKTFQEATTKLANLRQDLANVGKSKGKSSPATDSGTPAAPAAGAGTTT